MTVNAVNDAPTVAAPLADVTVDEDAADQVIDLSGVFADTDSANLTLTAVSSDGTLVGTSLNGTGLTLSFAANQNGAATVTVTADDGSLQVSDTFAVTVNAINNPPTVDQPLGDVSVDGANDVTIDLAAVFGDAEGDPLTFTAVSSDGAIVTVAVSGNNLVLSFPGGQAGSADVTVTATDSSGASVSDTFAVTVTGDAQTPGVTVEDGVLTIIGTENDDSILVKKFFGRYFVFTNIEGSRFTSIRASQVDSIRVEGRGGDDAIVMGWFVTAPTELLGGAGDDYIHGGRGRDRIDGGDGDDCLHGSRGNDVIIGGAGNDWIEGGSGHDIVYGGAGRDRIYGGSGNDILLGGAGNDRIFGGRGRDIIIGGEGADRLRGGRGQDIVIAGSTNFDDDEDSLKQVRSIWAGNGSFQHRRTEIQDLGLEVTHDDDIDRVFGNGGRDWLLFESGVDRGN